MRGARLASSYVLQLLRDNPLITRPSATLGVYTSLYLSQGGFFGVQSALAGIDAQLALLRPIDPDSLDEAYLLLQEFGGVLQVDIPDMLNRSTDRPMALNEYLSGLTNITTRAEQKTNELDAAIDQRNRDKQADQRVLSDIEKQIRNALREDDYATAGALQRQKSEAQAVVDETNSDIKRLRDVHAIYEDLLDLSKERSEAIQANREPLIAGLTVVDVPGIEELDVLIEQGRRSNSRDFLEGF